MCVCLSVCLSVYLSVCLSVCVSVSLCLSVINFTNSIFTVSRKLEGEMISMVKEDKKVCQREV